MSLAAWRGILIPFLGTSLGASSVFFLGKSPHPLIQRGLTGFAAGVMVAASVWSLLIPAMEQAARMGPWAVFPAAGGFWLGILFLLLLDRIIPHLHMNSRQAEGPKTVLGKTAMLVLAVTLHNLPGRDGRCGIRRSAASPELSSASALALSLVYRHSKFPRGSHHLHAHAGIRAGKISFVYLRRTIRVVELAGALFTILGCALGRPGSALPVEFGRRGHDLCRGRRARSRNSQGRHSNLGAVFSPRVLPLMMIPDDA